MLNVQQCVDCINHLRAACEQASVFGHGFLLRLRPGRSALGDAEALLATASQPRVALAATRSAGSRAERPECNRAAAAPAAARLRARHGATALDADARRRRRSCRPCLPPAPAGRRRCHTGLAQVVARRVALATDAALPPLAVARGAAEQARQLAYTLLANFCARGARAWRLRARRASRAHRRRAAQRCHTLARTLPPPAAEISGRCAGGAARLRVGVRAGRTLASLPRTAVAAPATAASRGPPLAAARRRLIRRQT